MYYRLRSGKQRDLLLLAAKKVGNQNKLIRETKITKSSFYEYLAERRMISDKVLEKLRMYASIKIREKDIRKIFPDNWKQIKGGKKCALINKKNGNFEKSLKKLREGASRKLKEWHREMKKNNPEEYYKRQYARFKRVGEYKVKTKRGEIVRNELEKEIADILYKHGLAYEYEPLVNVGEKYYFPDFMLPNKTIIEATMWRGYDKIPKLKDKIENLSRKYKMHIVVPKKLHKYYKSVSKHIVFQGEEFAFLVESWMDHPKKYHSNV